MLEYISIETTPSSEACTGVSDHNALRYMRIEARAYIAQLRRIFGENPEGTVFKIRRNPHDFGTYLDIHFFFDEDLLEHTAYATTIEEGCDTWDEEATNYLKANGYTFPNASSSDETDDGLENHDNGPTGHGDLCYSDADPGL